MNRSSEVRSADNEVFLRGRLAGAPVYRDLPSGDVLAAFRVTVPRPKGARGHVDSIECVAVKVRVHKALGRVNTGDTIEVVGRLHRRFWRTPTGPASRYAVEVDSLRVTKADRRGDA